MIALLIRSFTFGLTGAGLVAFFLTMAPWLGALIVFVCFFGLSLANVFEKGT